MSRRQRLPMSASRPQGASPLSYAESCRIHLWRRAWQRFGMALSMTDIVDMERQITTGSSQWVADEIRRHSLRVVHWVRVPRGDARVIMIFDVKLWVGVTILPGIGFLKGVDSSGR